MRNPVRLGFLSCVLLAVGCAAPAAAPEPMSSEPNPETTESVDDPGTADAGTADGGADDPSDSGTASPVDSGNADGGVVETGTTTVPFPRWLVGTYARQGKQENNVYFTSDDRSVTFHVDGTYSHTLGRGAPSVGKTVVSGNSLEFVGGALNGQKVDLFSDFRASCRILNGFGSPLFRSDEVASCPQFRSPAADDCDDLGTYEKTSQSGAFDGSGSGTVTHFTWRVTLHRDNFYTSDYSTFRTTCYAGTCKSLASAAQTVVGDWSRLSGAPPYPLSTLHSAPWVFTKSSETCLFAGES